LLESGLAPAMPPRLATLVALAGLR
jgi:hypothetical protein